MAVKSRGITINGHPTSLRLEPTFWKLLRVAAVECGCSITSLIESIAVARHPKQSITSAIRVYVAAYFYGAAPHQVLVDPHSKLAVRLMPVRNVDRSLQQARRSLRVKDDEIDARYGVRGRPPRSRAA
jgi:predicted DNA-binding ribbon-helix-helix protein